MPSQSEKVDADIVDGSTTTTTVKVVIDETDMHSGESSFAVLHRGENEVCEKLAKQLSLHDAIRQRQDQFQGIAIGVAGLYITAKVDGEYDAIEAIGEIGFKLLNTIILCHYGDRDTAQRIVDEVMAADQDVIKPSLYFLHRNSVSRAYDIKDEDPIASMLRDKLKFRSIAVHNYLADMQDKFGGNPDDELGLGEENEDDDTNGKISDDEEADEVAAKCSIRYCKGSKDPLLPCDNKSCDRKVHHLCSANLVLNKIKEDNDQPVVGLDGKNFCTVKCYKAHQRQMDTTNLTWSNDGAKGKDDPNHSEQLLANWLGAEGNYRNFRGPKGSQTKRGVCEVVAEGLKDRGVRVKRTPAQVQDKIEWFEKKMRHCIEWANNTGEGVKESDGQNTFNEVLKKMFPYYFELIDIFEDFASMKPTLTSDPLDLDDSSDDDSNENNKDDGVVDGDDQQKKSTPAKSSTTTPKKKDKTPKAPKKKRSHEPTPTKSEKDLNRSLQKLIKFKVEHAEQKKKRKRVSDDICYKVELAKKFDQMVRSLGGDKVKAARLCPEFKMFLEEEELQQV